MRLAESGGCQIPDDAELEVDLTGPMYGFSNNGQIQLERKQDMKARGFDGLFYLGLEALMTGHEYAAVLREVMMREEARATGLE